MPRLTPLVDIFDELAARADAGDADAACRLAWDLDLCRTAATFPQARQFWIDSAAREQPGSWGEQASVEFVDWMAVLEQRSSVVCAGASQAQRRQTGQRMMQAAQLGHPLSMARFALFPPFEDELQLSDADALVYFRDNALALLRAAAATGEPAGLFGLYRACSTGTIGTMHGDLEFERDPGCALAAALALQTISAGSTQIELAAAIPDLLAELDDSQERRAQAISAGYAARASGHGARDFQEGTFGPYVGETCTPPAGMADR